MGRGINHGGGLTDNVDIIKNFLGSVKGSILSKHIVVREVDLEIVSNSPAMLDGLITGMLNEQNLANLCVALSLCLSNKDIILEAFRRLKVLNNSAYTAEERKTSDLGKIEANLRHRIPTFFASEVASGLSEMSGRDLIERHCNIVISAPAKIEEVSGLLRELDLWILPSKVVTSAGAGSVSASLEGVVTSAGARSGSASSVKPSGLPEGVSLREWKHCHKRGLRPEVRRERIESYRALVQNAKQASKDLSLAPQLG